ncbi:MAG: outer membrane protein assembly factor BamD [Bacteroidaceae bacterium]|nr:outer membrane protein assembly factor BamD [Bacteroidaceae bacterium]MDO5488891.1 outer membrane protein assembly factor BamD [Bacteroidaceae bacterium]
MKKIPFLVVLFASVLLVSGCGEYARIQKTQDYEYKYEAAKALYIEGKYSRASQLLGDVLAILKGTAYGEECLYMLAMCAYNSKDYESASSYFRKYYQSYPKGLYVEHARYYSGLSLYNQTPDPRLDQTYTDEAISELQQFLDLYPTTQLKEQTQNMIYLLQDKLVEKEYLAAKMYFDLGTYRGNSTFGGSNYEACIVTAQNALKDYPFATTERREELSILILRSRFQLASQSVIEKRMERFRNVIDEFYAFANDFPESKFLKEAQDLYDRADKVVKKKNVGILEELKKEIVPLSEK